LATFDNPFFLHRDLLAILLHTPMGGMGHDLRKQQGVTMLENSTHTSDWLGSDWLFLYSPLPQHK